MSRGLKIFIKVVYYIFTFGLGILLALILPGTMLYETLANDMNRHLVDGEYEESMALIGGYYDSEYAYLEKYDDGSGVVMFKAMTIDDANDIETAQLCYAGFLFNVKDKYQDSCIEYTSKTNLIVNEGLSNQYEIRLLNHDSNGDGTYDSIGTLVNYQYVYFEIKKDDIKESELQSLSFYDKDHNLYRKINLSLNFDDEFFTSLVDFVKLFNRNTTEAKNERLSELEKEFLARDESYTKGGTKGYQEAREKVNRTAGIYVVIYFVVIFILGDFLVGQHFIIRFVLFLVDKIKNHGKEENDSTSSPYGTDYYTQVTFKLDIDESVHSNVLVRYSSSEIGDLEILLSKASNYEVKKRIHAGVYTNFRLESSEVEAVDSNLDLEVRGFNMEVIIHTKKKEAKVVADF